MSPPKIFIVSVLDESAGVNERRWTEFFQIGSAARHWQGSDISSHGIEAFQVDPHTFNTWSLEWINPRCPEIIRAVLTGRPDLIQSQSWVEHVEICWTQNKINQPKIKDIKKNPNHHLLPCQVIPRDALGQPSDWMLVWKGAMMKARKLCRTGWRSVEVKLET